MLVDDGLGGLSLNGGFEQADNGRPAGWNKFGGEMGLSDQAYHGRWAARLTSQGGSTKWLYQVIEVTPGNWYEASGFARMEEGAGEASIRLSWYAGTRGEGEAINTADSATASAEEWAALTVRASQPPPGAGSVRLRLMLRAAGPATAAFDDVIFREADAPPPETAGSGGPSRTQKPTPTGNSAAPGPTPTQSSEMPLAVADGMVGLRISEILSNPGAAGRDSAYEWVELVNTSDQPISTAGWKLGDSSSLDALPALVVPPGVWIVVAGKSVAFSDGVTMIRPADGEIGSGLGNDGDLVRLIRPDGTLADAVSYGNNSAVFEPPPRAPAEDQTIGRRTAAGDDGPGSWAVTLQPTPGEENVFAAPTPTAGQQGTSGSASRLQNGVPVSVERGTDDGSVVPSILLSLAGGAGILASAQLGTQALPRIRKRWRRGR